MQKRPNKLPKEYTASFAQVRAAFEEVFGLPLPETTPFAASANAIALAKGHAWFITWLNEHNADGSKRE